MLVMGGVALLAIGSIATRIQLLKNQKNEGSESRHHLRYGGVSPEGEPGRFRPLMSQARPQPLQP